MQHVLTEVESAYRTCCDSAGTNDRLQVGTQEGLRPRNAQVPIRNHAKTIYFGRKSLPTPAPLCTLWIISHFTADRV